MKYGFVFGCAIWLWLIVAAFGCYAMGAYGAAYAGALLGVSYWLFMLSVERDERTDERDRERHARDYWDKQVQQAQRRDGYE